MSFIKRAGRHVRANAVAYLALFFALGGSSAYAANTVFSTDIVDGEVKNKDIGGNQITTAKIYPGSVTNSDIGTDAVTPNKLSTAPSVSVLRLSSETTHTAQGATMHPDFEVYDTQGLHTGSSENLTAPVDGTYVVSASLEWDPNSTGYRNTGLVGPSGGFATAMGPPTPSPAYTVQNVSGVERLAGGQSVHVQVLQGSGSDLNARVSRFEMTLVGGF